MKQEKGPEWNVAQWGFYWHARNEDVRLQLQPAQPMGVINNMQAEAGVEEEDSDEGEEVDSMFVQDR